VISLRKLEGLPERNRARKLMSLLTEPCDPTFLAGLVRLARQMIGESTGDSPLELSERDRKILRQRLAIRWGIEVADWDLQAPADRSGPVTTFPFAVWLDDLRSPFNVGSVARTAEAYGFEALFSSLFTPPLDHPRAKRSAMGAADHLRAETLSLGDLKARWGDRPVFALELGGTNVNEFQFPGEGLVMLGGEELGLGPEALDWADRSYGRVSLPLFGHKASLNVGVAFGVLAAAWTSSHLASVKIEG